MEITRRRKRKAADTKTGKFETHDYMTITSTVN